MEMCKSKLLEFCVHFFAWTWWQLGQHQGWCHIFISGHFGMIWTWGLGLTATNNRIQIKNFKIKWKNGSGDGEVTSLSLSGPKRSTIFSWMNGTFFGDYPPLWSDAIKGFFASSCPILRVRLLLLLSRRNNWKYFANFAKLKFGRQQVELQSLKNNNPEKLLPWNSSTIIHYAYLSKK